MYWKNSLRLDGNVLLSGSAISETFVQLRPHLKISWDHIDTQTANL